MADMQGTYQYWGARLFSNLVINTATLYEFQMRVDSAARLWIDSILVIDATCMPLAHTSSI